jgi:adenosyl cobinamide kinase/adenosyl cobinamide phosphate guanylyltransferase
MAPPAIILVLGGTRSGKSEVAESLTERSGGTATYLATGQATDPGMAARIAAHQARRDPDRWTTVELADDDLPTALGRVTGPVLVDSLGTWLAGLPGLDPDIAGLGRALQARRRSGEATVLVSEEVGLGVHPITEIGRRFADRLGSLNRAVADHADQVLLVVAGRPLPLPPGPGPW